MLGPAGGGFVESQPAAAQQQQQQQQPQPQHRIFVNLSSGSGVPGAISFTINNGPQQAGTPPPSLPGWAPPLFAPMPPGGPDALMQALLGGGAAHSPFP